MSSREKVRLGDVLEATFSGEWGTEDGEVLTPVLRTANFNEDGSFDYETPAMRCIPEKKVAAKKLQRGDIVLEKSGGTPKRPVGIMAYYDSDDLALCSNFNQVLRVRRDAFLPRYAFHQLRWLKERGAFEPYTRKTTGLQNLQMKKFVDLELLKPELSVQRCAVEQFDAIEHETLALKRQIVQLDQLVKSRFVEMFGGAIHPTVKLAEASTSMRNGLSPSKNGCHHAKVLTLSAITQGAFGATAWKEGTFALEPPADKRVSSDDFYVCRGNGNKQLVGAGDFSPIAMSDLVFPDTVIAVKINQDQLILPFLKYAWSQPSVRKQIESSAKTTNGTFKINQTVLGSIVIPLPPLALQQDFAAFVAQVDKTRAIAQQQIDKLQTLYDSLAQDYFA